MLWLVSLCQQILSEGIKTTIVYSGYTQEIKPKFQQLSKEWRRTYISHYSDVIVVSL